MSELIFKAHSFNSQQFKLQSVSQVRMGSLQGQERICQADTWYGDSRVICSYVCAELLMKLTETLLWWKTTKAKFFITHYVATTWQSFHNTDKSLCRASLAFWVDYCFRNLTHTKGFPFYVEWTHKKKEKKRGRVTKFMK